MIVMIVSVDILFLVVALSVSIFYGVLFKQIWLPKELVMSKSRYAHEIWFNCIGSIIGWFFLYIVYKSLFEFGWQRCVQNILWQHIILFIIGIVGITGLLPYVIWNISRVKIGIESLIEFLKK